MTDIAERIQQRIETLRADGFIPPGAKVTGQLGADLDLLQAAKSTIESLRTQIASITDARNAAIEMHNRKQAMWREATDEAEKLFRENESLRAELAEARRENDHLRASTANSGGPCAYCSLPKEKWGECRSGFPGCGRADDAMLCPHVGAWLDVDSDATRYRRLRENWIDCDELQLHGRLAVVDASVDRAIAYDAYMAASQVQGM